MKGYRSTQIKTKEYNFRNQTYLSVNFSEPQMFPEVSKTMIRYRLLKSVYSSILTFRQ